MDKRFLFYYAAHLRLVRTVWPELSRSGPRDLARGVELLWNSTYSAYSTARVIMEVYRASLLLSGRVLFWGKERQIIPRLVVSCVLSGGSVNLMLLAPLQ